MSRPTRAGQARAATTRRATERPLQLNEHRGKLYIPEDRIPDGVRLLWVREATLGQADAENVSERLMDGWSPVDTAAFPDLAALKPPPLPGQANQDALVRRGGLLLMQRPIEDCLADDDALRAENQEILASVDKDRPSDRNFVATRETSSRVERNGRFED